MDAERLRIAFPATKSGLGDLRRHSRLLEGAIKCPPLGGPDINHPSRFRMARCRKPRSRKIPYLGAREIVAQIFIMGDLAFPRGWERFDAYAFRLHRNLDASVARRTAIPDARMGIDGQHQTRSEYKADFGMAFHLP